MNRNSSSPITAIAASHRAGLQNKLTSYLDIAEFSSAFGREAAFLRSHSDIFAPVASLPDAPYCDTLCGLLETPAGNVAVFHSRKSSAGPEGVGRTSLLLRCLGVELGWEFSGSSRDAILNAGKIALRRDANNTASLVACDWAYVWCQAGRLHACTCVGERLLGIWDLARHLFRRVDADYAPGKRLSPEGREILDSLVRVIPIPEFLQCYNRETQPRTIDHAIVLELSDTALDMVISDHTSDANTVLEQAMESVLLLQTPFWNRDKARHKNAVKQVLTGLRFPPLLTHALIPANRISDLQFDFVDNICGVLGV